MTTSDATPMPTVPRPDPVPSRWGPQRSALTGLFALLLLSLAGRTFFAFWEPPFDGSLHYDDVAALGGAYWPMNLLVGGPGYAISWVAVAIFAVLLARGRGAILTLVGAALAGIGGIVFALTVTAEVLPFAYAADPTVMPEAEGRALFDTLNQHLDLLLPAIIGTQLAIAVGMLLVLVGGLLSRSLPRWLAIAGIAYLVVFVGLPADLLGQVVVMIGYLGQVVLLAVIGWFGLRAAQTVTR